MAELKDCEKKVYIVNCNKCGAALKVKDGAYVYICGACKNLFQIRKMEKVIIDGKEEIREKIELKAEEELPIQLDIPEMETVQEEIAETPMEEPIADTAREEVLGETVEVEPQTAKVKEEPVWMPALEENEEEEGWEEDNRERPIWQEEKE